MNNTAQYKINTAYNHFLTKLVLWNGLYNKVQVEKKQGFNPVKNYEKMLSYQAIIQSIFPEIEQLDRATIKSFYPQLDDMALIQLFKDVTY